MRQMMRGLFAVLVGVGVAGSAQALPCAGFTDVDDTSPFCGNVTWLKNRGITLGCTSTTLYCPNDFVSRLQIAAFMNRLGDSLFPLTCTAGQVMKWDGLQWACANDALGSGAGTVTSVLAGTGLEGSPNPITGAGSLNLAPSFQLPQSCANGEVPKSTGSNGWACGADTVGTGTVRSITAGAGLTGGTITTIGTITVDPSSTTLTNAFFRQGGNTFGTTAHLGTGDNNAVEIHANGSRVMRYAPNATSPNVVGGHPNNGVAVAHGQTVAGGGQAGVNCYDAGSGTPTRSCANSTAADHATVGGGFSNHASALDSVVGGGYGNSASGDDSTVAGGFGNTASGIYSAVGGGYGNTATADQSTVAGGYGNDATGNNSTVAGGSNNVASGNASIVAGGASNTARGATSFAAGYRARTHSTSGTPHDGAFVWADSRNFDFNSTATDEFAVRAIGGVRFVVGINAGTGVPTWTCNVANGGSWACSSDREQKQNLRLLDGQAVLAQLSGVPIYSWSPKGENAHLRHYGPTAQDFHAAFGLGDSELRIGQQDADGVALAAIQGLYAQIRDRDATISAQRQEIAEQSRQLAAQSAAVANHSQELAALRDRIAQVESLRGELAALRNAVAALTTADAVVAARRE